MIKFNYLEMHLVDHCNLNCANCTHYASLAKPKFKSLELFTKEVLRLAVLIGEQSEFCLRLLGGEPLLHPQLLEFCKIARQYLPNANIYIITNGILIKEQTDLFFAKINEYRIKIMINNYKGTIYYNNSIILQNIKKCNEYIVNKHPGFSSTDLDFSNTRTNEEINQRFSDCTEDLNNLCLILKGDYLYKCAIEAYSNLLFDHFKFEPPEGYNIEDNRINYYTATTEQIEKFINIPSTFCNYCNWATRHPHIWRKSKKQLSEWVLRTN